jgi:hypothetical protein
MTRDEMWSLHHRLSREVLRTADAVDEAERAHELAATRLNELTALLNDDPPFDPLTDEEWTAYASSLGIAGR